MKREFLLTVAKRTILVFVFCGITTVALEALHRIVPRIRIGIFGMSPEVALKHPLYFVSLIAVGSILVAVVWTRWPPPNSSK